MCRRKGDLWSSPPPLGRSEDLHGQKGGQVLPLDIFSERSHLLVCWHQRRKTHGFFSTKNQGVQMDFFEMFPCVFHGLSVSLLEHVLIFISFPALSVVFLGFPLFSFVFLCFPSGSSLFLCFPLVFLVLSIGFPSLSLHVQWFSTIALDCPLFFLQLLCFSLVVLNFPLFSLFFIGFP